MNCAQARELLALEVEGDLRVSDSQEVKRHIDWCSSCLEFFASLEQSQSLLKSLRQDLPDMTALRGIRGNVAARTQNPEAFLPMRLRIERAMLGAFRRPRYALAGLAILIIVSVSLLGQMKVNDARQGGQVAVFDGDQMLRPDYREWVFVGSSIGLSYSQTPAPMDRPMFHNVYINPASYREFMKSGQFPDGTVMVLEMASAEVKSEPGLQGSYEKALVAVEASIKDASRFEGGWGYFGFTQPDGKLKDRASAFPDSAGCRSCHEERAAKDHVFTQFYPILRSVGAIMTP